MNPTQFHIMSHSQPKSPIYETARLIRRGCLAGIAAAQNEIRKSAASILMEDNLLSFIRLYLQPTATAGKDHGDLGIHNSKRA